MAETASFKSCGRLPLKIKPYKAGDVAAGMREAVSKTGRYRIRAECHPDNRDRTRGFMRDLCGL